MLEDGVNSDLLCWRIFDGVTNRLIGFGIGLELSKNVAVHPGVKKR